MEPARFELLEGLDFVFVCVDQTDCKRSLIRHLEARGIAFIDVGMGLHHTEAGLTGTLRVTTSTSAMRDHVWHRHRVPMAGGEGDDPYATNVQVVELNALNAAMAVARWKRLLGFYVDLSGEHFSTYDVGGNHVINEEEIFYPAFRGKIDDDLLNEAYVEHDGAKVLVNDIATGEPGDDFYDDKVMVLSAEIKHHVHEEEMPSEGMFAQCRRADVDLVELRDIMAARKAELAALAEASGLPPAKLHAVDLVQA